VNRNRYKHEEGPSKEQIGPVASMPREPGSNSFLLLVFVISFSGLTIEIILTRIFSVMYWYHYAFIAISIALLGWGSGAFVVYKRQQGANRQDLARQLLAYAGLFALSVPACLLVFSRIPAYPDLLPAFYAVGAVPFFFGGGCVSLAFRIMKLQVTTLYFADLGGAASATLALEPALLSLGPESYLLLVASVSSALTFILTSRVCSKRFRTLALVVLIINLSAFAGNIGFGALRIDPGPMKDLYYVVRDPQEKVTWTAWNSISRVDLVEHAGALANEPWIGNLVIDGGASTPVIRWDGRTPNRLNYTGWISNKLNYLPFDLVKARKVLIIGSGGGSEIAVALTAGVTSVTAVELNPLIVSGSRSFGSMNGCVYNRPEVTVVIDDGRSFVARSKEKYDLIDLRLVDTGASLAAAGGYALVENYLYTAEAFQAYLSHLTDNGVLFLVRWDFEMPKLVSLAIDALSKFGIPLEEAGWHIAALTDPNSKASATNLPLVFMIKKTSFSSNDMKTVADIAASGVANKVFLPGVYEPSPYRDLFAGSLPRSDFERSFYYSRVSSPTDDRPFFFAIDEPFPVNMWNLIALVGAISTLYAFILLRTNRNQIRTSKIRRFEVGYFISIGVAYILVEVTLVQEFMLFLGYPTHAIVTVLFSLLFGSGLGSFLSRGISDARLKFAWIPLAAITVLLVAYRFSLESVFQMFLSADASYRTLIAVLLIFPLGLLMGVPFPTGLRYLPSSESEIPLLWGINGIASVFGSVMAAAIAMALGFGTNILFGAAAYVIPTWIIALTRGRTRA
jgi:hypothetical protein